MKVDQMKGQIPNSDTYGGYKYAFTIFIPTFNRSYTLDETFESINKCTFRNFEVLIVDDGSTDRTREIVESWRSKVSFPVQYVFKQNGGKGSAHNMGLMHARGFFFFTLDAGDLILPDGLEQIMKQWKAIPEEDKEHFAGICGLSLKDDGIISGAPFDKDFVDSDFNQIYSKSVMKKEKRWALRLSVLRKYPYPIIDGEKYIRPTLILRRLSHRYNLRFVNIPLQVERQEPDGIRSNSFWHNFNSPRGQMLFFKEEITLNDRYHNLKKLYRLHVHYVRYSLHSGVSVLSQLKTVKHWNTFILAIPMGLVKWRKDLAKAEATKQH